MKRFQVGQQLQQLHWKDINGNAVNIPDAGHFVHLQFRRFSGCPICNIHMGQLKARAQELRNNNIKEVIVFYSEDKKIQQNLGDIPFTLIADPQKKLYDYFGVERSLKSVLDPRAWPAAMSGLLKNISRALRMLPRDDESMFGLPAEFLFDLDGNIIACKYGEHAYDQWTVDELLNQLHSQVLSSSKDSIA